MDDDIIKYIIPKLSGPQEPIDPEPTEGMTIPPLRVTVGPKAPDVRLASSVARSILFTLTSGGCYRTRTVRARSYEYSLFKHFFQNESHPIRPICPSANLWVGAGILCKQPELEQNFLVS